MTDRITNLTQSKQIPRYGKLQDRDWDRGDYVFRLDRQDAPSEDTELAGDQSGYEAYLAQFSKGRFAAAARFKIASSRPPTTNEEDAELRRLRRERQKPAAELAWLREDTARAREELENQRQQIASRTERQLKRVSEGAPRPWKITEPIPFVRLPVGTELNY